MKKYLLALLIATTTSAANLHASVQSCTISADEEAKLLALPYQEFDQSLGNGWRSYGDRECFALAAGILDRYNALHRDTMLDWQIRIVTWHAGQMYAFDNNYKLAKERFENSYNSNEPADTPLLWNDYVSATLAFLDHDADQLRRHRDRIANGLLNCIDVPYAVAYSEPSCRNFSPLTVFDQTTEIVTRRFYDPTFRGLPWSDLVTHARVRVSVDTSEVGIKGILNDLLGRLQASHTAFYSTGDQDYWALKSIFSHDIDGAPVFQIGAWFSEIDGKWFIRDVLQGSRAERAGLVVGDEVVAVDGQLLKPIWSFFGKTRAILSVRRSASAAVRELEVEVANESYQRSMLTGTRGSRRVIERDGQRIGYFHLWAGTHELFREALADAAKSFATDGVDAMVLDLRDGFGGANPSYLDSFFDRDEDGNTITPIFTKPMAVLINDGVRSGKEWIAFLFKDRARATLVGSKTAGYFLAGSTFEIVPGRFMLYLATQAPGPELPALEGVGVEPNIQVSMSIPYSGGADPQLERALQIFAIPKGATR